VKRSRSIEPLGLVLSRDSALRLPGSIETSPVSARDWEAAVGSRIAARARPVRLDRGVLVVRTASATWAQELALLADAILQQLRGRGVVVDSLRFRVGHVDAPERPPSRSEVRTAPPEVPLPPTVEAVLGNITDPDLRAAVAHAAARNLGWQVTREVTRDASRDARAPEAQPPAEPPATSARSAARAPLSAERGSARPGRTPPRPPAARRGKP
jgi:Dna[CI] antecedent, DciA